ncbi:MAG: tRNA (N6-threonylcarbamoyladenosine(37)-N6)-methyltransferase TrmO [Desulfonauticus sp.]|nr:tRNA (N6-threonylcarbamoyladenosine(37)-N6)-methyltransferase TrmO [Desulfonauticus sp.]
MKADIQFIGKIFSPLKDLIASPRQATPNLPPAKVVIFPDYRDGLEKLFKGQKVFLLTWLHLAERDCLKVHPGGDRSVPLHGVFATRSPHRPNPIGLHKVDILKLEEDGIIVHPLEAIDGTYVVDIKPCLAEQDYQGKTIFFPSIYFSQIQKIAFWAWQKELLSGFNGNISVRLEERVLITNSKTFKAELDFKDFSVFDLQKKEFIAGDNPSSEFKMHLSIYENQPKARAVLHTHPPCLNNLFLQGKELLDLSLLETKFIFPRFTKLSEYEPGSLELAQAVGEASKKYQIIYLAKHGLVVWGSELTETFALSEEIESLAKIKLFLA